MNQKEKNKKQTIKALWESTQKSMGPFGLFRLRSCRLAPGGFLFQGAGL